MNPPPPLSLPEIAAHLRDLHARAPDHAITHHFPDIAAQLDRADRELRHLRGLSARIGDIPTPEDLRFLDSTHEHWLRQQHEIDAEIASGA